MFVFTIKKSAQNGFSVPPVLRMVLLCSDHGRHNQNKRSSTEEDVTAVTHCRGSLTVLSTRFRYDTICENASCNEWRFRLFFSTNKCKPRVDYAVCFSLSRCHDLCFIRDRIPSCSVE